MVEVYEHGDFTGSEWTFTSETVNVGYACNDKMSSFKPDLVALSCTSDDFPLAKQIISFVHSRYDLPIIMGGIHATVCPEEAIAVDGVTGVCIGEGELAVSDFVAKLEEFATNIK